MKSEKSSEKQPQNMDASAVNVSKDKEVSKKKKRIYKINLYRAWCKNCGICAAFCPTDAIISDEAGKPLTVDEDKCIGCFQCFKRCPDFCITVFEDEEEDEDKSE